MKRIMCLLLALVLLFGAVSTSADGETWTCPTCGKEGNTKNFCGSCGTPRPEAEPEGWTCPNCGKEGNTKSFCSACGTPKPTEDSDEWTCSVCGSTGNTDLFCGDCGAKRPDPTAPASDEWTCLICGSDGNKKAFCVHCGSPRSLSQKTDTADDEPVQNDPIQSVDYQVFDDGLDISVDAAKTQQEDYLADCIKVLREYMASNTDEAIAFSLYLSDKQTIVAAINDKILSAKAKYVVLTADMTDEEIEAALGSMSPASGSHIYCLPNRLDNTAGKTINISRTTSVYKRPGTNQQVLGQLYSGTQLNSTGTVITTEGKWYEIEYKGSTAYILVSFAYTVAQPKNTATPTPRITTASNHSSVTSTSTPRITNTPSVTPTPTPRITDTPRITNTPAVTPTATPVVTSTPAPTATPTPTPVPTDHTHVYAYENGTDGIHHRKYCTLCGYEELLDHYLHYRTVNVGHEQYCIRCGYIVVPWTRCTYDEPLFVNNQYHTFVCSICHGGYDTPMLSHVYSYEPNYEPNNANYHTCICTVCNYRNNGNHHWTYQSTGDETTHAATCSLCGDSMNLNHTFVNGVCTQCGYQSVSGSN